MTADVEAVLAEIRERKSNANDGLISNAWVYQDLDSLVAALEAVLAVHRLEHSMVYNPGHEDLCAHCSYIAGKPIEFPCATRQVALKALGIPDDH